MHFAIRLFAACVSLCSVSSASADLVADPDEVNFQIGYVGVTSAPRFLDLRNTGNTALTIVSLTPSGGAFARAGGTCGTAPFALAAQASCTLGYTFTPFLVGPTSAMLRATPDSGNFVNFTLRGQGEEGGLRTNPGQLMFPLQAVGATVGPLDMTLRNTGPDPVTVIAVTPASGNFARDGGTCGDVPFVLAPQASCTLGYTFTSVEPGKFYQTLTATPQSGQSVAFGLAGESDIGQLVLSDRSITFIQEIPVGDVSAERLVGLNNVRRAPMQVTAITSFNPPPGPPFVRTGGTCPEPPFTLPAFGGCTVGYTFAPVAVGEVEMNFDFSNSTGSPESVTLRGTGIASDVFADGFETP